MNKPIIFLPNNFIHFITILDWVIKRGRIFLSNNYNHFIYILRIPQKINNFNHFIINLVWGIKRGRHFLLIISIILFTFSNHHYSTKHTFGYVHVHTKMLFKYIKNLNSQFIFVSFEFFIYL